MHELVDLFKNQKRFIFIAFAALVFQFISGIIIFFVISISQAQVQLDRKIQQIKMDIRFDKDVWDLSLYNNDPELLSTDPLYFFSIDGLVLDRRSPIRGFLDTSDYKRLLTYVTPQTIKNITGKLRRVYAKPILDKGKPVGVVAVSYYNPSDEALNKIDEKLIQTADDILTEITIHQGTINTNQLDVRRIPYDVSFTIVDAYNSILTKTANVNSIDRIPNFIDPSYIKNIISSPPLGIIRDNETKELFLIKTSPILKEANLIAVVVLGASIKPIISTLNQYLVFGGIFTLFIASIGLYLLANTKLVKQEVDVVNSIALNKVTFDEKRGKLTVNEKHIGISYATNQYYLLKILFSKPSKRWETDELLDRFGIDLAPENGRKVYDAMIGVNKKVSKVIPVKLILNQNKTYQLNQEILIFQ